MGMEGKVDLQLERIEDMERRDVDKVFVYGTLMEGFWNHTRILEGKVASLGKGEIRGSLYHLPEGYPALLEGEDKVVGEVAGPVDKDLLRRLDDLEGYTAGRMDNLYDRKTVQIRMSDGSFEECWVYVYGDAEYARGIGTYLPEGDWKRYWTGRQE